MSNEITYFNSFIAQRYTGIPYSTQWMVHIENIPDAISEDLSDIDTQTWNIQGTNESLRSTVDAGNGAVEGNIFAQAVSVPGEKINISRPGVDQDYRGGFMSVPIVNSRADYELLTIDFLETRDSFTDIVIRPWVIQVGFQGLIPPKDPKDSIKTTIWVSQFDRGDATDPNTPPVVRKLWKFYDAVPVSVDPDTVDYEKNRISILKTQWIYRYYTVDAAND